MLESFFEPASVAVVGASRTPGKVGYDILKNLLDAGFAGPIYPVNPKAESVLDLKCYADLASIVADGQPAPDLAIVVIPAKFVLDVIDQCGQVGTKAVIVISAGFKESGDEGAQIENELARRCAEHGIRCIGPNCLGVISNPHKLNASFSAVMPPAGNVAFFSQSGALGTAVLDVCAGENIGISLFVSFGNKADVSESDLIDALGEHEGTDVLFGYLESINDGARFMEVARRVTKKKPVIILKSGRTAAGARAASSHTGSLAGSDAAYEAAFKQSGVIRARNVTLFFDYVRAFSTQGPPAGNAIAIVTNAGGPGIIATDAIESSALEMAELSEATQARLAEVLPSGANTHNPIDVLGDAHADRYGLALDAAIADENVDAVLVILTPQTTTEVVETAAVIADASERTRKPVLAAFMGSFTTRKGSLALEERGVPNYAHPERAVQTLEAMYHYHRWATAELAAPGAAAGIDRDAVRAVLDDSAGAPEIGEREARRIVEACGLRLPAAELATSADEAARAASKIGYPVVMKISSDDIIHKSDAGGVRVGLADEEDVRTAFAKITENAKAYNPDARIDGVLVEQMVRGGTEVIVGMNRDPQFGPLIMFGVGGVYVELLKDVTFRVAPVSRADALEMIDEIKMARLLEGFRDHLPADLEAIADCLVRVSELALAFPELAECDLNPLVVFDKGRGAVALDARFTVRPA